MTIEKFKIPISMLSPTVDPAQLGFDDTSELEPLNEIIGQERAVEALEFGLHMKGPGFNLYVSGPVGTGKGTLVRNMVKRMAQGAPGNLAEPRFRLDAVLDFPQVAVCLTGIADATEDFARLVVPPVHGEPARALGDE